MNVQGRMGAVVTVIIAVTYTNVEAKMMDIAAAMDLATEMETAGGVVMISVSLMIALQKGVVVILHAFRTGVYAMEIIGHVAVTGHVTV